MAEVIGLLLGMAVFAADAGGYLAQLRELQRAYDQPALEGLLVNERADASAEAAVVAESLLTLAEWKRIAYEQTPAGERAARQKLGDEIDALAQEALAKLDGQPESSELWRMRADLHGVMMRTTAQKRKYKDAVEQAIAKSLELGQDNARAWATGAKPHLFAEPGQGQNLQKAIELLNKSLELDPGYEAAKLLRALAREKLGETATARRDYAAVLEANPKCRPASDKLKELEGKQ